MKKVIHISTECYPAAKAGGMGDVVGALPIYLPKFGIEASVIIPKYDLPWIRNNSFDTLYEGTFYMDGQKINFSIERLKGGEIKFPLYCANIPGKFDRNSIYLAPNGEGFYDEVDRNLSFQRATLEWLIHGNTDFDVVHCHDHQTSFLPFMLKYAEGGRTPYASKPTYYTIHNAVYNSVYNWSAIFRFPKIEERFLKILDWNGNIDGFASALKCAWRVNTVSPHYMKEITWNHHSLSMLLQSENSKCKGILNGIDDELWDPKKDQYLKHKLKQKWDTFKSSNKNSLLESTSMSQDVPLIGFVGRFAHQKGADVLIDAIQRSIEYNYPINFYILGSGDSQLEYRVNLLAHHHPTKVGCYIGYSEATARLVYAGSDFLIMPSRFEPCGLNQMFAMRYGTIPVVNATGGLVDTVPDYTHNGYGIQFHGVNLDSVMSGIRRASDLYFHKESFKNLRDKISTLDWSWDKSAAEYAEDYKELIEISSGTATDKKPSTKP